MIALGGDADDIHHHDSLTLYTKISISFHTKGSQAITDMIKTRILASTMQDVRPFFAMSPAAQFPKLLSHFCRIL